MSIHTHGGAGETVTRRGVVGVLSALGTLLFANPARAISHACRMMVSADEGPFYPVVPIPESDDLTFVRSPEYRARGEQIFMYGRVVGSECAPVAGAIVEIWQADMNGRYVHPRAPNDKPIDPNFRYFAATRSGTDGFYRFRTIRPAPYDFMGLKRAAHIHVRVGAAGHGTMTSEMYFAGADGDARRLTDQVFNERGARRDEMIVAGRPAGDLKSSLRIAADPAVQCFEYELSLLASG